MFRLFIRGPGPITATLFLYGLIMGCEPGEGLLPFAGSAAPAGLALAVRLPATAVSPILTGSGGTSSRSAAQVVRLPASGSFLEIQVRNEGDPGFRSERFELDKAIEGEQQVVLSDIPPGRGVPVTVRLLDSQGTVLFEKTLRVDLFPGQIASNDPESTATDPIIVDLGPSSTVLYAESFDGLTFPPAGMAFCSTTGCTTGCEPERDSTRTAGGSAGAASLGGLTPGSQTAGGLRTTSPLLVPDPAATITIDFRFRFRTSNGTQFCSFGFSGGYLCNDMGIEGDYKAGFKIDNSDGVIGVLSENGMDGSLGNFAMVHDDVYIPYRIEIFPDGSTRLTFDVGGGTESSHTYSAADVGLDPMSPTPVDLVFRALGNNPATTDGRLVDEIRVLSTPGS